MVERVLPPDQHRCHWILRALCVLHLSLCTCVKPATMCPRNAGGGYADQHRATRRFRMGLKLPRGVVGLKADS